MLVHDHDQYIARARPTITMCEYSSGLRAHTKRPTDRTSPRTLFFSSSQPSTRQLVPPTYTMPIACHLNDLVCLHKCVFMPNHHLKHYNKIFAYYFVIVFVVRRRVADNISRGRRYHTVHWRHQIPLHTGWTIQIFGMIFVWTHLK